MFRIRGLLIFLLLLGSGLAGAAESDLKPSPYSRVQNEQGTVSLQIAAKKFKRSKSADVWLVGVSHIGEPGYYQSIQKHLEQQSLVLFEGVGGESWTEKKRVPDDAEDHSLQTTLAKSLGLVFQLDSIDYTRKNFRNSDLDYEDLRLLFSGKPLPEKKPAGASKKPAHADAPAAVEPSRLQENAPQETGSPSDQLSQIVGLMDGSSFLGALMNGALKVVGSSPRLQSITRLMMIEMLGRLEGDLAETAGVTPELKNLFKVLIKNRNERVISDLETALKKRNRSIAIFYGAGHMDDLEKRLCRDLKFEPAETRWFTAFSVDPEQSGISSFEMGMVRSMVQWQMNMLQSARPAPAANDAQ